MRQYYSFEEILVTWPSLPTERQTIDSNAETKEHLEF